VVDHFDESVKNWILAVAEGAELWMGPPNGQRAGSGVGLYLLEIMKAAPINTAQRPVPLQLTLKYLVTTWSDKPEDAHQQLVGLMLAAMGSADYEMEAEPLPASVWTALGAAPQPSFLLRVPFSFERPAAPAKLVRHPLKIQAMPVASFYGLVLGPDETPLSNCRVEIPSLRLSTSTDYTGRFCFPCVSGEGTNKLLVKAKGRELAVSSDRNYPDSGAPLVINFSLLEE
jgi:hypothetical protein